MNLKNQKGINMITLSIAVIILVIITSVLVYNAKDSVKVKTLKNLYNDIEQLNNKVSAYYVEHGDIPKSAKYENLSFLSTAESNQVNPNNGDDFYVINLKALEGVSLNYGRDFNSVSSTDSTVVALNDIYIINDVSHQIYYPRGIEVEGKTYYTEPDEWTSVDLSVIPIYTAEQMSWVGDGQQHIVNGINYTFSLNGTYILKNDIDLSSVCSEESGRNWNSIGTSAPFTGTFYGNGHEVQNIYINNTTNNGVVGLFKVAGGNCKIIDLGVTGKIISEVSVDAGGIAGVVYSDNSCDFINCYSKVNITSQANTYCIGGILSASEGTTNFINCYNNGYISGSNHAGGIIGLASGEVTLDKCYNVGKVTNMIGSYCGGLVGVNSSNKKLKISNSYNEGNVSGTTNVGGIIGLSNGDTEITNCENQQKVTGYLQVGGITGNFCTGTIEKCENSGQIEGTAVNTNSGRIGGITGISSGTISECENHGNIVSYSNGVGGICGSNHGTILKCYNDYRINVETNEVGGIVGYQKVGTGAKTIDCYNTADIKANKYVGGIVGDGNGEITNCYNTGNVSGTMTTHSILGSGGTDENTTITNCYYLSTLSITDEYATPKSAAEMTNQNNDSAFLTLLNVGDNINGPWQLDTNLNNGYPILKWQTE